MLIVCRRVDIVFLKMCNVLCLKLVKNNFFYSRPVHVENSSSGHCIYAVSIVGRDTALEVCDGMFKYMRNTSIKISCLSV